MTPTPTPTPQSSRYWRGDRRRLFVLGAALAAGMPLLGTVSGCGRFAAPAQARSDLDRLPAGDPGSVPLDVSDLAARLVSRLVEPGRNLIMSPLSVLIALAMTRNGAAGDTAVEMDQVLGIDDLATFNRAVNGTVQRLESRSRKLPDDEEVKLEPANSLWAQQGLGFEPAFLDALAQYYGAGMLLTDFAADPGAAIDQINRWVDKRTHGLVPAIVGPSSVDVATRLVLVNALYLKAPWRHRFAKYRTQPRPFTTGAGGRIEVPTMAGDTDQWYADEAGQATRIDYAGGDLAMAVVLPRHSVADTVAAWGSGGLHRMLTGWQSAEVELTIPTWRHEWQAPLNDVLADLGMPRAFGADADFSAMTTEERLQITAVSHRASIAVDEEGTEAAAATAVAVGVGSAPGPSNPRMLRLDRPYLYVLHDIATATPLFVGVVNDPRS